MQSDTSICSTKEMAYIDSRQILKEHWNQAADDISIAQYNDIKGSSACNAIYKGTSRSNHVTQHLQKIQARVQIKTINHYLLSK